MAGPRSFDLWLAGSSPSRSTSSTVAYECSGRRDHLGGTRLDTAEITGSAYPDTRLGIGAEPSDPADTPSPPVPPPGDVETAVEVAAASAERSDPYLLLAGLPPVNEYLGFIHQAGDGRRQDLASWVEAWRTASSQRELLARAEIGVCDTAPAASLSPHLQHLADDLLSDRTVIRSFSMMPMRVGMVDLDTLIVYQRHINLGFARQLQRQLPPATEEDLFRFCLLDRSRPPVRAVRMGDAWLFASVSNDLRIVDPVILRGDEVPGLVAPGMVEFIVGVAVGLRHQPAERGSAGFAELPEQREPSRLRAPGGRDHAGTGTDSTGRAH